MGNQFSMRRDLRAAENAKLPVNYIASGWCPYFGDRHFIVAVRYNGRAYSASHPVLGTSETQPSAFAAAFALLQQNWYDVKSVEAAAL